MNEANSSTITERVESVSPVKWYSYVGPGFIMAAIVFGPGSLTIMSRLGAGFKYSHLWVIVVTVFFMATFVDMAIRIGLATEVSLLTTIRNKWGKYIAWFIGVGCFLVCASFQAVH